VRADTRVRRKRKPAGGRSLKTQQRALNVEVDVVLDESGYRTAEAIDGSDAYRSKSSGIP